MTLENNQGEILQEVALPAQNNENAGFVTQPEPQSPETNAQFAAARRESEAKLRARLDQEEKIAQMAGFDSFEEMTEALTQREMEQQKQQFSDTYGIEPDVINEAVGKVLENHPLLQKAKKDEEDRFLAQNYSELTQVYGDYVKTVDDIPNEVFIKWQGGQTGLSLADAFGAVMAPQIATGAVQKGKQAALSSISGRSHLHKPSTGMEGMAVQMPQETLQMYRDLFPNKTDEQIFAHYKKTNQRS